MSEIGHETAGKTTFRTYRNKTLEIAIKKNKQKNTGKKWFD
tara:strand:+ start:1112 stop:1234 length:123 start_codon:yes stop_codon:yes gene_type:complete